MLFGLGFRNLILTWVVIALVFVDYDYVGFGDLWVAVFDVFVSVL